MGQEQKPKMPSYANQTERLQQQSLPVFPAQSSFHQLFGDTFATNPASSLYLLENLNSAISGTALTNNNAVTFPQATDLLIKPVNVGLFDGVDQYLSLPTESSVEVGTGSFVASIWFKTSSATAQDLVSYGDAGAGAHWLIRVQADGNMRFNVNNGAGASAGVTSSGRNWADGLWHVATMMWNVDEGTNGTIFGYVDGELLGSGVPAGAVGDLNGTDPLIIGGITSVSPAVVNFVNGSLANFSLYKAADYNLPAVLNAGIRESASIRAGVGNFTLSNQTASRTNSSFFWTSPAENDYITTAINVSEGIYDILGLIRQDVNGGITEIAIDDETVLSFDAGGALTTNVQVSATGIFLTAGIHILKLRNNGTGN